MGQSLAIETGQAMRTERFEEAVLPQSKPYARISVLLGLVAGFPFQQRGRLLWRKAMHKLIHDQRYAEKLRIRNEEIARVEAAQAEQRAREAAAEAKAKAAKKRQTKACKSTGWKKKVHPSRTIPPTRTTRTYSGLHGRWRRIWRRRWRIWRRIRTTKHRNQRTPTLQSPTPTPIMAKQQMPNPAMKNQMQSRSCPLELEPRFDIESAIVVEVSEEDVDPDANIDAKSQASMRRIIAGMVTICCLTAGWSSTPPWFSVLSALPDPHTSVAVPITDPGLSIARPPMTPSTKSSIDTWKTENTT